VGPIAAAGGLAVGAYTGSLHGAVNTLGEDAHGAAHRAAPAGVRLARILCRLHIASTCSPRSSGTSARSIEEAEGRGATGSWVDFDPVSAPRWLVAPPQP
jgi:hypothetical protein